MNFKKEIEYWGTGFKVKLSNFPSYQDDGHHLPDVPLGLLHKLIALKTILKPHLLSGYEMVFLRSLSDMSRSKTAREFGITRRTLINWEENGDQSPKTLPIIHLAIRLMFYSWIFKTHIHSAPLKDLLLFEPIKTDICMDIKISEFESFQEIEERKVA